MEEYPPAEEPEGPAHKVPAQQRRLTAGLKPQAALSCGLFTWAAPDLAPALQLHTLRILSEVLNHQGAQASAPSAAALWTTCIYSYNKLPHGPVAKIGSFRIPRPCPRKLVMPFMLLEVSQIQSKKTSVPCQSGSLGFSVDSASLE